MKKWGLIFLLISGLVVVPTQKSHAVWWWVVKAAVKKAIKAADLAIQKQQNKVIWLQNAQKTVENTMSKLKLDEISDWTQRQRDLYKDYFDELKKVKAVITYYQRIRAITASQLALVEEYKRAWALFRKDKNFSAEELENMGKVYEGILESTIDNINQLGIIINSFRTQMSDAKRLEIIAAIAERVDNNYFDLKQFNTENALTSLSRTQERSEVERSKRLHGIGER
ncbi:hypothetical protein ABIE26_002949 [Pedobacter africanus]|uniref:conjugal transfer protein TraI n=1 Tax=Pedobacter africanus TaxID=151894 RepID=UPI00339AFA32